MLGKKCTHCGQSKNLRDGREFYTPEDFKKSFGVGDTIRGWPTNKHVTITAIGLTRFLCTEDHKIKESVCKIDGSEGWALVRKSPYVQL